MLSMQGDHRRCRASFALDKHLGLTPPVHDGCVGFIHMMPVTRLPSRSCIDLQPLLSRETS